MPCSLINFSVSVMSSVTAARTDLLFNIFFISTAVVCGTVVEINICYFLFRCREEYPYIFSSICRSICICRAYQAHPSSARGRSCRPCSLERHPYCAEDCRSFEIRNSLQVRHIRSFLRLRFRAFPRSVSEAARKRYCCSFTPSVSATAKYELRSFSLIFVKVRSILLPFLK